MIKVDLCPKFRHSDPPGVVGVATAARHQNHISIYGIPAVVSYSYLCLLFYRITHYYVFGYINNDKNVLYVFVSCNSPL
jgi:hypothetical protein